MPTGNPKSKFVNSIHVIGYKPLWHKTFKHITENFVIEFIMSDIQAMIDFHEPKMVIFSIKTNKRIKSIVK